MSGAHVNFDFYKDEFDAIDLDPEGPRQQLETSIGTERYAIKEKIREDLDSAKLALDRMRLAKNDIPSHDVQPANEAYNIRLSRHQALKEVLEKEEAKPDQSSNNSAGLSASETQRMQSMRIRDSLGRSNQMLDNSEGLLHDINGIAGDVSHSLLGQRETIAGTHDNLSRAERPLDNSLRTVRGMERRRRTNKLIMYAIIAVLVLLILFVLASKFR